MTYYGSYARFSGIVELTMATVRISIHSKFDEASDNLTRPDVRCIMSSLAPTILCRSACNHVESRGAIRELRRDVRQKLVDRIR